MDRADFYRRTADTLCQTAGKGAELGWEEQFQTCAMYATVALCILDHYQGKRVPTEIPLEEERLIRLNAQVTGALDLELLMEDDPRIHQSEFWLKALQRAEAVLKGFTKRTP